MNTNKDYIPGGFDEFRIGQFTPEQEKLFGRLFSHVSPGSYMERLARGDEKEFAELEAPALKQFSGELGQLSSQFSGMGTGGRKSSGFQNIAAQKASDFASNLQQQRQDIRRKAIMNLMGMSEQLLGQRPTEKGLSQQPEEGPDKLGQLALAVIGLIGGGMFGNPIGGAQIGYQAGA